MMELQDILDAINKKLVENGQSGPSTSMSARWILLARPSG